jgi:histidinol phosphatase-like enzyme
MKQKYILIFFLLIAKAYGQRFAKTNETITPPGNIIISNYFPIEWSSIEPVKSLFDINNNYTYMVIVSDKQDGIYHILYQTDFSGNIIYIGLSNNLTDFFYCTNHPMTGLFSCVKKNDGMFLPAEISEKIISCIISRLNCCKE